MPLHDAQRIPVATYRVQLNAKFGFAELQAILPYLDALGITDCYCSPIMLSAPGSTHGYDVADYRKIEPDLGGGEAFYRLSDALQARGMGAIVDFVPNHMGVNGAFNAWWQDVLESGPRSPRAEFFDIQWHGARGQAARPRVLVPVLDDHFGRVLERGGLAVRERGGVLTLNYGEMAFPLRMATYARIMGELADEAALTAATRARLRELAADAAALTEPEISTTQTAERTQSVKALKQRLAELITGERDLAEALRGYLERLNGRAGEPRSFDTLGEIIEAQHYRLARWKTGAQETNYRRFFAIDSLAGLRMENPEVFRESHLLIGHLIAEGKVTGLRIDHVDGLRDPQEYLERLQALPRRRDGSGGERPLYVVVEKILETDETLPAVWMTQGTTGYEFITQLAGLLVEGRAEARFTETHAAFTGERLDYEAIVYRKKLFVLTEMFANSVSTLTTSLLELLGSDRQWRDLTYGEMATVVRETMAALDVYRTYRRRGEPCREADRKRLEAACARAIARNPRVDAEVFELLRDLLTGAYPEAAAPADVRGELEEWALTFQQYTGAVMAKAVEDTTFYVYTRFVALNEVGGDAGRFGAPVADFHAANEARRKQTPQGMLATSTHDTKMSEDVRARLYALSEIPDEWARWVETWRGLNARHKSEVGGRMAPDASEEYRLYQILLGAWPLEGGPDEALRGRLREHGRKAVNEAQVNTTWRHPNEAWLAAGDRFLDALLTPGAENAFLAAFGPAAQRVAHLGMVNSLTQVVLKCTVPGVPDFYQGNESWDFSLVDPDNRRAVDFARLQELTGGEGEADDGGESAGWRELLRSWRDGRVKLAVTRALLRWRRAHAALFQRGDYRAVKTRGRFAENAVAFSREAEGERLLVVVPRLTAKLGCPPLGLVWDDTRLETAEERGAGEWRDVLTGRRTTGERLELAGLLEELPFAVLWREG